MDRTSSRAELALPVPYVLMRARFLPQTDQYHSTAEAQHAYLRLFDTV